MNGITEKLLGIVSDWAGSFVKTANAQGGSPPRILK